MKNTLVDNPPPGILRLASLLQEYFAGVLFAHVNLTETEAGTESMKRLQEAANAFFKGTRICGKDAAHPRNTTQDGGGLLCCGYHVGSHGSCTEPEVSLPTRDSSNSALYLFYAYT